jgi:competence protein ComEC
MDTGGSPMENSFDINKYITLPYLEKLGINSLKAIFISHFHADHSQGVPLLIENLKVENIVGSYIPKDYEFPIIVLKQYDEIMLDKDTKLKVIWAANTNSKNENNLSLVALLTYYDNSILFTGDIEAEVEPLVADILDENIDILKVPHHGSSTSSTDYFLNKLKPSVAVFSVGRNNLYNHPSTEVVSRYENINSEIYRTDKNGLVKISFNKENYTIKRYLDEEKLNLIEFIKKNTLNICFYLLYCSLSYILIKIYIIIKRELEIVEL